MGIDDLRARLMSLLAGALGVGCGPSLEPSDGDDGAASMGPATGDPSTGTASASGGMASSSGPSTSVDDGTDADTGPMTPKYDVGGGPPIPPMPPVDCPPQPRPPVEACTAELPPDRDFEFFCVELPEGESCEDWVQAFEPTPELDELISACVGDSGEWCQVLNVDTIGCGPLPDFGDQCCSWFIVRSNPCAPEGRPFVVDGGERLAGLVERHDWIGLPSSLEPSPHHDAIAAVWLEQALAEHASIASFSRFILQLMACGAPASLVSAAHVALGEEIEHARLFFSLAARFAGRSLGPGALDVRGALVGSDDFDEVVLATVREGCIVETLSAWRLTVAAGLARDPSLAAALSRAAEQELEHAALAWRVLAWALPRASASLRRRIDATLDGAAHHAPLAPLLPPHVPDEQWRAHGILPSADHDTVTQHALRELVAPLARALRSASPVGVGAPALHG